MSTITDARALNLSPFAISALAHFALNDESLTGTAREYSRPYLEALTTCESLADTYGADSADMLARYALSNLTTWRGANARAWKAEINARLRKASR